MQYKVPCFFRIGVYALLFLSFKSGFAQAQIISGAATKWNDSFVAWEVFGLEKVEGDTTNTDLEEVLVGNIQQRWLEVKEDWTEWDFAMGSQTGTIKIKWKNDPSQWELRTYDGDIITMKAIWKGDVSQWRITDNDLSFDLKSRYTSQLGEWSVKDTQHGSFNIAVTYSDDPRDWTVTDQMDASISPAFKMAMLFIAIYHASPKI